jgi:hypothetical protein
MCLGDNGMENMIKIWEIKEHTETTFEYKINIYYLFNNIGQMLTDLINTYKFFYSGLGISEDQYVEFKHTIELNLILSKKYAFNILKNNAQRYLSQNYLKDIIEIVIFQLVEVCQIIHLLQQGGMGYNKTKVDNILKEYKVLLNEKHLPELLNIVEEYLGQLYFSNHLKSVNTVRRILVHKNGCVDKGQIELLTRTPKLFTTKSYSDINYSRKEDDGECIDFKKQWKLGDNIILEYDDCFRISFTVISFFTEMVYKLIAKHPLLDIKRPT